MLQNTKLHRYRIIQMHVPDLIHHVTFYLTTSMEVIGILKSEAHFKCINIIVILMNFWQPQLLSFFNSFKFKVKCNSKTLSGILFLISSQLS